MLFLHKNRYDFVMKQLKQFSIYNKEGKVISFQKYFILQTN